MILDELLYQHARGHQRGRLQLGEAAARFADSGGGDDRWTNILTLCDRCHPQNIHEHGSLAVTGEAPNALTFVFGREPIFVVCGRELRHVA